MSNSISLARLGWQNIFQQQLSLEEWELAIPARIMEQHRSVLDVATEHGMLQLPILKSMPELVVGDWLLLDQEKHFSRLLERKSWFSRKSAGTSVETQLISANVDTAFILCSLNDDFNLNRIERFLALVHEASVEPVVILSKSDLVENPEDYLAQVRSMDSLLMVEAINCLDSQSVARLSPWIKEGRTIAVLGSSGVGKSTLVNTLIGETRQATGSIREDDDKGRHTTTRRSIILLASGGLLLDTPGMRQIQLADCKEGIAATFADIEELAKACRYSDCKHAAEPGCAVKRAVENGILENRRLQNYLKLQREEAFNSASLAEKRAKDKALGRFYKRTMDQSRSFKGRE